MEIIVIGIVMAAAIIAVPLLAATRHKPQKQIKAPAPPIDHGGYIKKLQALYRSYGYDNIPEVENEESAKWVLDNMNGPFGAVLVPKEYMANIKKAGHDYTTGEIVLLWWLTSRKSISNKPLYFYREYGIDAEKSTKKLINNGLLTEDIKLTAAGKKVLDNSKTIIKHHRAVKSWSGTGPVKYSYPAKQEETKVPEKYGKLTKLEKTPWKLFDMDLADAKSDHLRYVRWNTSTTPCPQCRKMGATDNGKGPGVYPIKSADYLREQIHKGCTCRIFGYKVGQKNLPELDTYWNRDPKTGKGYYVKRMHY